MNPLHKKLLLKENQTILTLNAPDNFNEIIGHLPEGSWVCDSISGSYDVIIAFVLNSTELQDVISILKPLFNDHSVIWVSYPKKSSGIVSDLTMASWDLQEHDLSGIAAISVNEKLTAIRLKRSSQVKRSGLGNAEITQNELGKYIDVEKKVITLPPDFQNVLKVNQEAMAFFTSLSYSNRKEYVTWILTAKQQKTRLARIEKSIEKLRSKKKNPVA